MKYQIIYAGGRRCQVVNSRAELLNQLAMPQPDISDIRKVYKNGATDGVMDKYFRYIKSEVNYG